MNHDATHCWNYCEECPKDCYRAQLTEELKHIDYPLQVSYASFKGTDECPKWPKRKGVNMNREEAISFAEKVSRFMDLHGVGISLACCHLKTYPNVTEYCSGHGMFGDNRDSVDCKFKDYCKEIAERSNEC